MGQPVRLVPPQDNPWTPDCVCLWGGEGRTQCQNIMSGGICGVLADTGSGSSTMKMLLWLSVTSLVLSSLAMAMDGK